MKKRIREKTGAQTIVEIKQYQEKWLQHSTHNSSHPAWTMAGHHIGI